MIKPGFYRHHKGDVYRIHHVAINAENETPWFSYTRCRDGAHFVRSVADFNNDVYKAGVFVKRFELIEADDEPITDDWCKRFGEYLPKKSPQSHGWYCFGNDLHFRDDFGRVAFLWEVMPKRCQPTTVGAVRRLCEALGIELRWPQ